MHFGRTSSESASVAVNVVYFQFLDSVRFLVFGQSWILATWLRLGLYAWE